MDDIQRKLALIDRQLAGGRNFHRQIISTAPLLFAAVGLIAGILIQSVLFESRAASDEARLIWFWLILLALCTISAGLFFVIQRAGKLISYAPVLLSSCALICFLCLGAIRLTNYKHPQPNDIRNFVSNERTLAVIRGRIITEPYINKYRQWQFAKFRFTDPAASFYLKLAEVKTIDGWAKASGTIRVQVDEWVLTMKAGDYIQAYCWLDRFKPATNPGQFDTAKYLARKNVFIAASVKSRDGIELLERSGAGIFTKIKRKLRETATQALLGNLSTEDRNRGLLQALLLGYRSDIDSATYRAFRKTGLLHFISLSGLHLGILAGIVWWLCKTMGLMKPTRAIICIIAIGIFLLIVPPRAPTLRAAIICWVFCASFFFRRKSNPLNTLSFAAIILLLIRPTQVFEAGWQLSFTSVLGIILFADSIHFFLYEKIMEHPWQSKKTKAKPFWRIIAKPGPYVLRLFSVGFAAWLGGAGILLYHFYTINPLTSIWTVIVFPLVAVMLTVGYLKIILSFLLPTVASVLGVIVTGSAELLIWIVECIAHLDVSQILIGHVSLAPIILYYCFVLFVAFAYFRRPLIKKAICTTMVLALVIFLGTTKWQRTHRDNLVMTCLDVGHGQAILAQLPGKANILFDAGSLYKNDIGRRIVTAFLNYSGISKIDAIIISHNDVDHINAIPAIVEHCRIGTVYANEAFINSKDEWGTVKFLRNWLNQNGLEIEPLGKNLNISKRVNIKILWPNEKICQNEQLGDNDKSAVLLIEFAGNEILLCSDIEKFAQRQLLQFFPNLKPEVIVVPHHGSANTLEHNFLEKLKANILLYSCSRSQYKRQQKTRQENKPKAFYTASDGAITVCLEKDGIVKVR